MFSYKREVGATEAEMLRSMVRYTGKGGWNSYHSRCINRPFQRVSNKPHPKASICVTKPGVVTHFIIPALEKLRKEDQGPSLRYCKVKANLGSMRFCHQNQKQKNKKKLLWILTLKLHYLETVVKGAHHQT